MIGSAPVPGCQHKSAPSVSTACNATSSSAVHSPCANHCSLTFAARRGHGFRTSGEVSDACLHVGTPTPTTKPCDLPQTFSASNVGATIHRLLPLITRVLQAYTSGQSAFERSHGGSRRQV